ncbi:MAG: hypothetical protein KatS3mg027_2315 [Bacteroidia bacterium]|nr:MAG: hypothetical protein KatS3mg027_2315 [Bacteroidia bacterium]
MYYLRTKAAADAIKFTVEQSALKPQVLNNEDALVVELSNAGTIDKKVVENLVPDPNASKINLPIETICFRTNIVFIGQSRWMYYVRFIITCIQRKLFVFCPF